jgi:carbon storage regulator CsrA
VLILSRRTNEKIRMTIPPCSREQTIELTVVRLPSRRSTVRLGLDAPRDIDIVRDDAKKDERAA